MWKKSLTLLVVVAFSGCGNREASTTPTPQPQPTPTLEDSLMDKSILTGEPCEAPCWYGLEVGKSTKTEVLAVVSSLTFIDSEETFEEPWSYWDPIKQESLPSTQLLIECRQPKDDTCVAMEFVNDKLRMIILSPNYYLSFQEVVEHLGDPDYVTRDSIRGRPDECNISLEWSQLFIVIISSSSDNNLIQCSDISEGKRIDPNLPVHFIYYTVTDNASLIRTPDPWGDFLWTGFIKP